MLGRMALLAATGAGSTYDADAQSYITAVEAADGQALEAAVKDAINAFVVGCKADGIWSAIKASCILAGARTLAGCLVPLVGTAPTNSNFVSADYNRKTGLIGNGSNKRLNSNRNNNADPQNSSHNLLYVTQHTSVTAVYMGATTTTTESGTNNFGRVSGGNLFFRNRINTTTDIAGSSLAAGLYGTARQASSSFTILSPSSSTTTRTSQTPFNGNVFIFSGINGAFSSNGRASFYSIGEYLDPSLLATRTATLMSDLAAAIP